MRYGTAVESLAASLYSACSVDLPDVIYEDRDWDAYRALVAKLSNEERSVMNDREQRTGRLQGPRLTRQRRPAPAECTVLLFPQTWPSTAIGLGGIGGHAITEAYTVVVTNSVDHCSAVYFGGQLAYLVSTAEADLETFSGYLKGWNMPSVDTALRQHGWSRRVARRPRDAAVTRKKARRRDLSEKG